MSAREQDGAGSDPDLLSELRRGATWGFPKSAVVLRQSHSAWVFLVGERAFKVKKPIVLPYLNFGTRERRRAMCEREVALNRRLAPELYLGVRRLVRRHGVLRLGDRNPVEFAVEMRRFREAETLAGLVAADALSLEGAAGVGGWLAALHGACPPAETAALSPMRHRAEDAFATLSMLGHDARSLERFVAAFVETRRAQIEARTAMGLVRDAHGDLRAEHILLRDGRLQAIDCVEYSDELRQVDIGVDLGFLAMDLVRLDRPDLAAAVVEGYRAVGDDPGDDALIAFHATCAALVRAKFAFLRAMQLEAADEWAGTALAEGDRLLGVASELAWRARMPIIVAVTGEDAALRARVAEAVRAAAGIRRLGLEGVGHHLSGVAALPAALHDERPADPVVYAEMLRLASAEVGLHGGALVEGPFTSPQVYERLPELAAAIGARLVVAECAPTARHSAGPESVVVHERMTDRDAVDLVSAALDRSMAGDTY